MSTSFNGVRGLPAGAGAGPAMSSAAKMVTVGGWRGIPEFYCYPIRAVVGASAQNVGITQAIVNWPFVWTLAIANSTAAFEFSLIHNGPAYAFFNASGSNANNGFVLNSNFWGTAQQPNPVMPTYTFGPQTSLTITVNELSGAQNTINFLLRGYQLLNATRVNQ